MLILLVRVLTLDLLNEELNNIFEKYFYINNYALHVTDAVMKKTQILEITSYLKNRKSFGKIL